MTQRPLDASELLRIDYGAERSKLAAAALDAPWRVIAELVRRAVRAGARRVQIRCEAAALVVADDGAPPEPSLVTAFAACRDPLAPEAARHAALLRLEAEPGLIVASAWRRASIGSERGETQVRLEGYRLDGARRAALGEALRFCGADVSLDGAPLARGFSGGFAEGAAPAPLRGALALGTTASADVALVLDGVVVARVSLAEAPPFAVWIDGASVTEAASASPAGLREAIARYARPLVTAAADLALASVSRQAALGEAAKAELLETLLACARLGLRRAEVLRAPVLQALVDGRRELRSLLDLGREARANNGTVTALDSAPEPGDALLPAGAVYVLNAETRARIAALLDVRFRPVASRAPEAPPTARARRALSAAREWLREAASRLCHPRMGPRLERCELEPAERALLDALGAGVAVCAGNGPVRRAPSEWRLPRRSELVGRAARAVAADRRWRYAASLALFRGRREAPAEWAGEWRRSAGSGEEREL